MKKIILVLGIAFTLVPRPSFAWGPEGHHIVAEIAFSKLDENTRANVMKYLGSTTIEEASVWMDDKRHDKDYDFMKPWHYINIEKGNVYVPTTDENVVNELIITLNELKHKNTLCSEQVKTDLEVLFHLIGDLHQPLHAGYGVDRGGNTIEINFMGEGSNLHWVWDSKIIENQKITLDKCLEVEKSLSPEQVSEIKKIDVVAWMNDARSYLPNVYDFTGHVLGEDYAKKNAPIIEKQLVAAGMRLAAVLEQDFGSAVPMPITTAPSKETKQAAPSGKTITIAEAVNHIGETETVCGKVYGGKYLEHSNGTPTLINMGAAYPNSPFTLVIFGSDRSGFDYKPEEYLNGKEICITGQIKMYKDKPEIIVSKESQIQVK